MKLNILVVEDYLDIQAMICDLVALEGHKVTAVDNKTEALQELSMTDYDVVLTDNDMPAGKGQAVRPDQGLEIIRCAREVPYTPHIIWMSGRAGIDPDLSQKALDCGADEILPKPFEIQELIQMINRASARKTLEVVPV